MELGLCIFSRPMLARLALSSGNALLTASATRSKPSRIFVEMLAIKGTIVSIDAMGTQKAIAAKIVEQEADYVLALKGNQSTLHDDVKSFLEDAELAKTCAVHKTTDAGHGRIEERECRATDAIDWLV